MPFLGGFGEEFFGDILGGGGPLTVIRARAIKSQTVRIALSEEPRHFSPAGTYDALNPSNYVFSIDIGQATAPQPVGVSDVLVVGPTLVVPGGGAWGVDVLVDRALVSDITYRVTLNNIASRAGGALGSPDTASFVGSSKLTIRKPPPRKVDLTDVANDPFDGAFRVDDSGDLGIEGGQQGLRKRMLRRASTPKNGFSHLPGYGVGIILKKNFSPAKLAEFRTDLRTQLLQEPEIADVAVSVTQLATNAIQVMMRAKTKTGAIVDASTKFSSAGISVP